MSSSSEDNQANFRRKRVIMDSDEEQRLENEKKAKELQKEKRRQEKELREKEQEERRRLEKQQEIDRKAKELSMMDFSILLEPDSNSHTSFTKIRQRIKVKYPKVTDPYSQKERKVKKESKPVREKEREREKEVERSNHKEKNREKDREREREKDRVREEQKPKVSQTKLSKKEEILYELMRRWWYAIPEQTDTPAVDYQKVLKEKGYILLAGDVYRRAPNQVNGLLKIKEVENFPGVFKRQDLIVDLRPKANVPSIENFQTKDVSELMNLLRKALKNQIKDLEEALEQAPYKSKDQLALLSSLKQKLDTIS